MPGSGPITSFADIDGWFSWLDKSLFDAVLRLQADQPPGDLVELGTYLGRSAVVIGAHLREGERFVVVDLFEDGTVNASESNRQENLRSYKTLSRRKFEENYLALHATLPVVVQGPSTRVVDHVAPGRARFIHIDASHLYDQVREDVVHARVLAQPQGVVVLDDYRAPHTPGVAAAAWQAVIEDGFAPFLLTPAKLHGTFGDPTPYLEGVRAFLAADRRFSFEEQSLLGHRVIRIRPFPPRERPDQAPATVGDVRRLERTLSGRLDALAAAQSKVLARAARSEATTWRTGVRAVVKDLLPPVVTRRVQRLRRKRSGAGGGRSGPTA